MQRDKDRRLVFHAVLGRHEQSWAAVLGQEQDGLGLARARHLEGPWEKYPHNPVFKPTGSAADFDGAYLQHPCPVKVGGQWRLYYNGWTLNPKAKNPIKAEYAIGLAVVKP